MFDDIVGQSFAKKYLEKSIRNDKIKNSYIFEGEDGIGKKKMAYELSKILLDFECVENSIDFIDVYPNGSSFKIEQIRNIQTDIVIKPHGRYKIYILNDAQKMTREAQNALLKTLEEPPSYAIIILLVNNKEMVLDTIKSRCDIIKFNLISTPEIKKYLLERGIEQEKADLLSSLSRGSLKRALELEKSSDFLQMRKEVFNYIKIIFDRDTVKLLELINSMSKYKPYTIDMLDIMTEVFRDIVLLKNNVDVNILINRDDIEFLNYLSGEINYSQALKIIVIIEESNKKVLSNCNFNINLQVMLLNIYEVIK